MNQTLPFSLKADPRGCSILVGSVYRQALVEIGYSPDRHVYDLDREYIDRCRGTAAGQFLASVIALYDSLPNIERKLFLCDCLERGRHYVWWWYEWFDRKTYSRMSRLVQDKVRRRFAPEAA